MSLTMTNNHLKKEIVSIPRYVIYMKIYILLIIWGGWEINFPG
jgi:hypothetical protein